MGTLAVPQGVFRSTTRTVPRPVERTRPEGSVFRLVVTYAMLTPLLFLAARGGFSVQGVGFNSRTGAALTPDTGQGSALHSAELIVFYSIMLLAMVPVCKRLGRVCVDHWQVFLLPGMGDMFHSMVGRAETHAGLWDSVVHPDALRTVSGGPFHTAAADAGLSFDRDRRDCSELCADRCHASGGNRL